ncbi:short-chain dehydrogenase/reductase SDR [Marasmius fiardii PR-910]|nr:short-chain dehydrogenase/reductase SDR [Marasmius fiardii PR-910]
MATKTALRPLVIVAGVGAGSGTGAASAKLFSKAGYDVALIARNANSLKTLADEINSSNFRGKATPFPTRSYCQPDIHSVLSSIWSHYSPKESIFRIGIFNIGYPVFKPFLETTPEEWKSSIEGNTEAAYGFSRQVIPKLLENETNEEFELDGKKVVGGKGSLIFTGATAALRGGKVTSAFSAAKGANRNLNHSLAKEFWPQGIHVAHAIIDGRIQGEYSKTGLDPESIAQAYLNLARQDRTAWTWELDLRPAEEAW